ncbi:MAG: hypothetical protein ACW981_21680, partial [Candidatus Hodarchaeales archaeon]
AYGAVWIIQAHDLSIFKYIGVTFVNLSDPLIGVLVHFGIAIFFGFFFGLILVFFPYFGESRNITIISAIVYGILIWATLAKFIPSLLNDIPFSQVVNNYLDFGQTWFVFDNFAYLLGHILYGLFLGFVTWQIPKYSE